MTFLGLFFVLFIVAALIRIAIINPARVRRENEMRDAEWCTVCGEHGHLAVDCANEPQRDDEDEVAELPEYRDRGGAIVNGDWRPDPSGEHQLRYFSDDGSPTEYFRDGDSVFSDGLKDVGDAVNAFVGPSRPSDGLNGESDDHATRGKGTTRFCESCGGPVGTGAKFCSHCGSQVMPEVAVVDPRE
jgi:hypothetical protein